MGRCWNRSLITRESEFCVLLFPDKPTLVGIHSVLISELLDNLYREVTLLFRLELIFVSLTMAVYDHASTVSTRWVFSDKLNLFFWYTGQPTTTGLSLLQRSSQIARPGPVRLGQ